MGSAISYLVSFGLTLIVADGSAKLAWPPSPSDLPYINQGLTDYEREGYHVLTRWAKEVGDIYSVLLGRKRIIVLNSAELVKKAFVEQDQYNSTRLVTDPTEKVLTDQGKSVFAADFAVYWTRLRRSIVTVIGKTNTETFHDELDAQAEKLSIVVGEALSASDLRQLVDLVAMDTALTLTVGNHNHDPQIMLNIMEKCRVLEGKLEAPYTRLGFFFSLIGNLIAVGKLLKADNSVTNVRNQLVEAFLPWLESAMEEKKENKKKVQSILASLLQVEPSKNDPEPTQLTNDEVLVNTIHITLHAFNYLSSAIFTLIQRLATEPELQQRLLQQDSENEFARAFVHESLRIDPPTRLIAHGARIDYDLNDSYRVDVESELIANLDAIHADDRYYPKPNLFNPDRFLKSDKKTVSLFDEDKTGKKTARDHLAFGAGRRVCLGSHMSVELLVRILIRLVKTYELQGGDVNEKIQHKTNIWSWTGRTETKGATVTFKKRV
ncbi:cytochrome P450 [Backusella circina FSU 941]|nr:cytochrome P450 [Backusella circina FSU 941]